MKKVELKTVELAALIAAVDREISLAVVSHHNAKQGFLEASRVLGMPDDSPLFDHAALDHWTERLNMLRELKAKLEREDEEPGEGSP